MTTDRRVLPLDRMTLMGSDRERTKIGTPGLGLASSCAVDVLSIPNYFLVRAVGGGGVAGGTSEVAMSATAFQPSDCFR